MDAAMARPCETSQSRMCGKVPSDPMSNQPSTVSEKPAATSPESATETTMVTPISSSVATSRSLPKTKFGCSRRRQHEQRLQRRAHAREPAETGVEHGDEADAADGGAVVLEGLQRDLTGASADHPGQEALDLDAGVWTAQVGVDVGEQGDQKKASARIGKNERNPKKVTAPACAFPFTLP